MKKLSDYNFEFDEKRNCWGVVQDYGNDVSLRTGDFTSPEAAIEWFRRELDVELEPKVTP